MTNDNNKPMTTPDDFLVTGLEKIQPAYAEFPGKMYAGLIPVASRGKMMFWLFEPDTQSVEDTLVIWLNGGPGCSSFNCGVMMEHSPVTQPLRPAGFCCLKPDPELFYNQNTWTKATTMLYVEQPIGTGFSYGHPLPETEADVSADIYVWLQNFYNIFEHLRPYNFYVMGESYAGMFVPSIARYIHLENQKGQDKHINLKGAAIGNGWVNPYIQGPATIDYSWWHGLIDKPTRDALHIEFKNCIDAKGKKDHVEPPPFHPFNVQDDCGIMWGVLSAAGGVNAYDVTTWDPNVDQVTFTSEAFYNRPDVKAALHAPTNITWHGCRWGEGRRLSEVASPRMLSQQQDHHHRQLYMDNDRPLSVVPYIADLLDGGIPVLVYNGDRDMTTNMVGTELTLNDMDWTGKDKWLNAKRGLWMVNDTEAGWSKEYENLSFVVVYNSGHMVPYNQPGPAFDLLTRFLVQKSYMDVELPQIRTKPDAQTLLEGLKMKTTTTDALVLNSSESRYSMDTYSHNPFMVVASFLVGVICTLFLVRRQQHQRGYQSVPNVTAMTDLE